MPKRIDLTGQKFEKLKVVSYVGKTNGGKTLWECECKCGNIAVVRSDRLKNGDTKSCGCERVRKTAERSTLHGNSKKRLYRIWRGMIKRTSNENVKEYHRYGGRGISICKEWRDNFESFEKWALENGYKDNLTIDRKNNDGNYSPENCRWVNWKVQESNRGDVKKYTYKGGLKTIPELAEMANMRTETLRERIKKGMEISEAVETPVQGKNAGYKPYKN